MNRHNAKQIRAEQIAAHEALDDALAASEQGRLRTAVSRAYYACFHATKAMLGSYGETAGRHEATDQLLDGRLANPEVISAEGRSILLDAYAERDLADYHALTGDFDFEQVHQLLNRVRRLVAEMDERLADQQKRYNKQA